MSLSSFIRNRQSMPDRQAIAIDSRGRTHPVVAGFVNYRDSRGVLQSRVFHGPDRETVARQINAHMFRIDGWEENRGIL